MIDESDQSEHELLLAFLKDRDVECPLCHYNLRNCTAAACPECGKEIRLAVAAKDVFVLSWATMTIALCLTAGIGLVFILMIARQGLRHQSSLERVMIFGFIGTVPLAIAAFVTRRRFLRLRRNTQFNLAAAAIAIAVVLFYLIWQTMMSH